MGFREFPDTRPGVVRYDGRAEDGTVATASWYEANGRVTLVTDPGGDPFDAALEAITQLRDHVRRTTA